MSLFNCICNVKVTIFTFYIPVVGSFHGKGDMLLSVLLYLPGRKNTILDTERFFFPFQFYSSLLGAVLDFVITKSPFYVLVLFVVVTILLLYIAVLHSWRITQALVFVLCCW